MIPELGTRRPPGQARSFGTARARALARPRDPRRKALPHSHPTSPALLPRPSANFPKNAPTPGHPAGQRGRCCWAPAVKTRPWPWGASRHLRGCSGAPEWAAAADASSGSAGPASAGDSSRQALALSFMVSIVQLLVRGALGRAGAPEPRSGSADLVRAGTHHSGSSWHGSYPGSREFLSAGCGSPSWSGFARSLEAFGAGPSYRRFEVGCFSV